MVYARIAVVSVRMITMCMVVLVMLVIWKTSTWRIALFFVVCGSIEIVYLSSVLYKFTQGGFLPLVFALFLMTIMGLWHYLHKKRYMFELSDKVSSDYIQGLTNNLNLANNPNTNRMPGVGLLCSKLVQGIHPIFSHFISNIPSIHSVLVFILFKPIMISKVVPEEWFMLWHVKPRDYRMFCCIVRYGYNNVIKEAKEFKN